MLELDGAAAARAHPGRVPADVLRGLEDGGVSVNHMEQIAMDLGTLLASQFPYPVMETRQHDAICHDVLAPVALPAERADEARRLAVSLADGVDAAGLLAVELFLAPEVLVNELALRPHNCGHPHHRRVPDLAIRPTPARLPRLAIGRHPAAGTRRSDGQRPRHSRRPRPHTHLAGALAVPQARVRLSAKIPSPGPKLGHVTALGETGVQALHRACSAAAALVSR